MVGDRDPGLRRETRTRLALPIDGGGLEGSSGKIGCDTKMLSSRRQRQPSQFHQIALVLAANLGERVLGSWNSKPAALKQKALIGE